MLLVKLKNFWTNINKFFIEYKFELVIFVIISILMLSNLSNIYLWDDEGETVLLGKNILSYGIPKVYDGKNLVARNPQMFNSDFIWTWSSWLHLYIASLSFLIFGFSTFSARFIFVIIGILSFFPIVILLRKVSINKLHYYLSVLFLLFFVPYYLYSRQSRYYALLIFLISIIAISIYNLSFKNGSIVWFVVSFVLLFHSNYLSFFALILSTSLYFLIVLLKNPSNRIKLLKKLIISYAIIFFLTFPWALYIDIFEKAKTTVSLTDFIMRNIEYIFHSVNSTVPLLLIASSIFFMVFFYFKKNEPVTNQKIFFVFFNGMVPLIILIFSAVFKDIRYIIGLFPLWISFIFLPIVFLLYRKDYTLKIIGVMIFLLIFFTNIFYSIGFYFFVPFESSLQEKCSFISEKSDYCDKWVKETFINPKELKYPFFYYLYEITHDYDGPIEGIVKYLNSKGDENSIIFANNWYFSIQFYTNMKVLGPLQYMDTDLTPDYIVVNFPNRRDIPRINYLVSYGEEKNYTKVTLPYPDLPWDNRPVIWYHKFWTQPVEVPVTVYVKTQ